MRQQPTMTAEELQALLARLGPRGWRVFQRETLNDEPHRDLLVQRILVRDISPDGYYTIEYDDVQATQINVSLIGEPAIVESGPNGHLLNAVRKDGELMQFSTLTLTDAMAHIIEVEFA